MKRHIILIVTSIIIPYLIFAFINFNLNIAEWGDKNLGTDQIIRLFLVACSVMIYWFSIDAKILKDDK